MDDHLVTLGGDQHDDLEEIRGAVGADDQPTVRVVAQVVDGKGVFDSVEDVSGSDAVSASG